MKKVSFTSFFTIYAIALLLCVGLQSLLKFTAFDPLTGFYTGGKGVVLVLQILLLAAILFWFVATLVRGSRHDYALNYRHIATSVFSIGTGLSILVYTLLDATRQTVEPMVLMQQSMQAGGSFFRQKLTLFLVFALGILAAVSMIVGGIQPNYGRYGKPGAILGVIPCLWQLLLLLTRFNFFQAITTLSDVLFTILFMCFASIFLLGQSRIIYGLGVRNGRSYAFPAGMATSLLGFTLVIPNYLYAIANGGAFMPGVTLAFSESLYILMLSIYAPVFLYGFSKSIHTV